MPRLVIAGQAGWLCNELVYQMRHDPIVQDSIVFLHGLHDGHLNWLYERCLFTIYPSHYEGWGLPVSESLAHGKFCVASSSSSIPEIAGDLLEYHDPYDFDGCKNLIAKALFDEAYRAERERRVRAGYRPTSWAATAEQVWQSLAETAGAPREVPARKCA
jgi:hypothetical protein